MQNTIPYPIDDEEEDDFLEEEEEQEENYRHDDDDGDFLYDSEKTQYQEYRD